MKNPSVTLYAVKYMNMATIDVTAILLNKFFILGNSSSMQIFQQHSNIIRTRIRARIIYMPLE